MTTPKQQLLDAIRAMPDDATWEQLEDRVDLVAGIAVSERQMAAGQVRRHDDVMREMETWLTSSGRPEPSAS